MAIYPPATYRSGLPMGDEISPCIPGTTLTLNEANVVGQSDPVEVGEPCVCGSIIGVCVTPPSAANENLVVATSGIFSVPVVASDSEGTENVTVGALLYVSTSTAVVSLINTGKPFGYALAATAGSATATTIPVKLLTV